MAEEVFYVRNRHPNRLILKLPRLGLDRIILERRGTREDSTALPADAKSDPVIKRWMSKGVLEEVSREAFMGLAAREVVMEADRVTKEQRQTLPEAQVKDPTDRDLPMESETQSRTPYIIHWEDDHTVPEEQRATKEQRSPSLEYVNEPEPTPEPEEDSEEEQS